MVCAWTMKLDTMTKCISCKNINCRIYTYIIQYSTNAHTNSIHTNTYLSQWTTHTHTDSHTHLLMVAMERDYIYIFFFVCKKNIEFKEERTRDGSKCLSLFFLYTHLFSNEFCTYTKNYTFVVTKLKKQKLPQQQKKTETTPQMNEIESITNQNECVLSTLRFLFTVYLYLH